MSIPKNIEVLDFWLARKRIKPYIHKTPLVYSAPLSDETGVTAYLKLENLQNTGSFKIRGAANKILCLPEEHRLKGVAAFSTGNHGLAVSYIAKQLGIKAYICMSKNVPEGKINSIKRLEGEIIQVGNNQDDAERFCYDFVAKNNLTLVKPFDDYSIIAGQGTIGLELLDEAPDLDLVIVPLSGGGLISGIAVAMKTVNPNIKIIGVSMERSAVMHESLLAGKPIYLPEEPTLADSLLGGIGLNNEYTFELVKNCVDKTVTVSEEAIAEAIIYMIEQHRIIIEGASATGIAYLRMGKFEPKSKVAVVVSGNNINLSWIKDILDKEIISQ